ncbi:tetratricopeptide repeat protein [Mucilaginibacter calamicampi]|uniref:Tetratricopeptide repeat protein n=1 Tax=Mucilaginibacter calamicampi TaxID=1302352 RepID=A0ABW2YQH0_9SPHI
MKVLHPLNKIGFFNPGRLSDREIEDIFVARIPFFNLLLKKIVSETPDSIPQHYLIIGQRGMGKSSLLSRLAAEIRKPSYQNNFIPLSFPEEQYNIDRLSKFWLNCLDALADALDKERKTNQLVELDNDISVLSRDPHLDQEIAYKMFDDWARKIGRRPVLLVDNLDLIFSKITKEDQHQLRAILMSKGAPILVSASSSTVDATVDYQAPFYDAFQISYLKKLTFEESLDVLSNLARLTGNEKILKEIFQKKARLHALYQLTGGTPRTLAILFPLIQSGFSDELQNDLDALLDLVTPLYKARFDELSPQLQVVLDAVALNWDPMTLKKLREATMLDNPQLSPQTKRLIEIGWLQKIDAYKSKGGALEVSERFFNIWYLMRRSSRRQKRELYCLTKFLESFYGSDLKELALSRMSCKSRNADHIALDLALADAMNDTDLRSKLRRKGFNELFEMSLHDKNLLNEFSIPEDITLELFNELNTSLKNQQADNAQAVLQKLLRINDQNISLWITFGQLQFYIKGDLIESEKAFRKVLTIDPDNALAWSGIGEILYEQEDLESAQIALKKAISYNKELTNALSSLANIYIDKEENLEEAENLLKRAIEIEPDEGNYYTDLGRLYQYCLNAFDKSEVVFKKAIEINDDDYINWYHLGILYRYRKNFTLSEDAFIKALKLSKDTWSIYLQLGLLYMYDLKVYKKAESIIKKGLKLVPQQTELMTSLGYLYLYFLPDAQKAEDLFKKGIALHPKYAYNYIGMGELKSKDSNATIEAEDFFQKAVQLDSKSASAWNNFGVFYVLRNRYQDAEQAFLKAVELNKNNADAWRNLGYLYAESLGLYDKAKHALTSAVKLDPEDLKLWITLGNIYMNNIGDYLQAADCFNKALKISPNNCTLLNIVGNLNSDYLKDYQLARKSYQKAIEIDSVDEIANYNLVFLLRDKMDNLEEAKELFKRLKEGRELRDSYLLNKALFAYYDKNQGIAEKYLIEALEFVDETIPAQTIDDWYRAVAVIIKLNYGEGLLNIFQKTGYDITFKPLYVAIQAIVIYNDANFLNSVAVEVREPAEKIWKAIQNHMS